MFLCPLTGERLQVNNKEVFQPEAWFKFIHKSDDGLVSVGRQEAKIHFPLKSLREACMWKLLFLVRSKSNICELEIPKTVKADLLHAYNQSTRYSENVIRSDD